MDKPRDRQQVRSDCFRRWFFLYRYFRLFFLGWFHAQHSLTPGCMPCPLKAPCCSGDDTRDRPFVSAMFDLNDTTVAVQTHMYVGGLQARQSGKRCECTATVSTAPHLSLWHKKDWKIRWHRYRYRRLGPLSYLRFRRLVRSIYRAATWKKRKNEKTFQGSDARYSGPCLSSPATSQVALHSVEGD